MGELVQSIQIHTEAMLGAAERQVREQRNAARQRGQGARQRRVQRRPAQDRNGIDTHVGTLETERGGHRGSPRPE